MGFRFRKSFKLGPFRFTASKSGISSSFGVKGFRVTKRADGKTQTTVSIPGTGISHVSTSGGAKTEKQSKAVDEPQCVKSATDSLQERPSPYEFVKFYLSDTQSTNEDGQKRQDILYLFKMRRPPFDGHKADLSLVSDTDTPDIMQVAVDGMVVGDVPAEKALFLNDSGDRIDAVTALEVEGRRGTYDAEVYVRLRRE